MNAALPAQALKETAAWDNPMGLMGFEFVEFTSPQPGVLEAVFEKLGFTLVAKHRSKDVVLYRQNGINFILNREPHSQAAYFGAEHGPSACGLAQRSAAAAKEIKTLIDDSVAKVGIGTQLVERAGTTMGDVVQGVKSVTAMVAEISAASSEQSAGIAQVNQAVTQMDQGTQQNAALVEEALAAAQSLSQQALALSQVVGKFRVA